MIELSESAASHFRNLIASQNIAGLGIRIRAVGAGTPLARLRLTKAHMDALKRSPEPVAMRLLFDIFGRTPKLVSDIPSAMLHPRTQA